MKIFVNVARLEIGQLFTQGVRWGHPCALDTFLVLVLSCCGSFQVVAVWSIRRLIVYNNLEMFLKQGKTTFLFMGIHFSGSPFVFKVTAQPDASKVRVVGPGVEHGILATFVSRFIVETKGAGAGQLTVRIRGPKGKCL